MVLFRQVVQLPRLLSKRTLPQTKATFQALAEAILPGNRAVDDYMIWTLDHLLSVVVVRISFNVPLANSTAELLNTAARQLVARGGNREPVKNDVSCASSFAALASRDRIRTLSLLDRLDLDTSQLPFPFYNTPGFVTAVSSVLNLLATIGYFSEWSGYGPTRLEGPEKRKLVQPPSGWQEVGYPGPAKGYHALRGYLVNKFTE